MNTEDAMKNLTAHDPETRSADILAENIETCKELTKDYVDVITYVVADSKQFLKDFEEPIDFLYLDSFDSCTGQIELAQEHCLRETMNAYPKLREKSIILIDDFRKSMPQAGKGHKSVAFLEKRGWKLLTEEPQALLIKK